MDSLSVGCLISAFLRGAREAHFVANREKIANVLCFHDKQSKFLRLKDTAHFALSPVHTRRRERRVSGTYFCHHFSVYNRSAQDKTSPIAHRRAPYAARNQFVSTSIVPSARKYTSPIGGVSLQIAQRHNHRRRMAALSSGDAILAAQTRISIGTR
jgi:hypothetical protein